MVNAVVYYGLEDIDKYTRKISSLRDLIYKVDEGLKKTNLNKKELEEFKIKAMNLENETVIALLDEHIAIYQNIISDFETQLNNLHSEVNNLSEAKERAINKRELEEFLPNLESQTKVLMNLCRERQNEFSKIVNSKGN